MLRKPTAVGLWLMGTLLCGCGDGFPQTHFSGKVTLDGQPIPDGTVSFSPDGTKGSQGIAEIKGGRYDTRKARGYAGGPTLVYITGIAGQRADYVFQYQSKIDLPKEGGSHDFDLKTGQGVRVMPKGGEP